MKTFNLYYYGNLTAVSISHPRELPKSATIHLCDYIRNEDETIGRSVNVYKSISKGGIKLWAWTPKEIIDTSDFY